MAVQYVSIVGTVVSADTLTIPKASELGRLLRDGAIEYATLVDCRSRDDVEVVVFDARVELGQLRVNPIQRHERIAVEFDRADARMPEVLALREDFPAVPHVNLRIQEVPRSLCVYGQAYRDLKRTWTPSRFIEDIRSWLARTAKGTLHEADQQLEPLLLQHEGHLVLPADFFERSEGDLPEQMVLDATLAERGAYVFVAQFESEEDRSEERKPFVASLHRCAPVHHGIIRRAPADLHDLGQLIRPVGLDLLAALRERIERWRPDPEKEPQRDEAFLNSRLVLVITFPKTRTVGGPIESWETWAFLVLQSIREIGIGIGLWSVSAGPLGRELTPPDDRTGKGIPVGVLNPVFKVRRSDLARLNGLAAAEDMPIVAVGAGALGSQVVMNLARSGFGTWTVIDDDIILPHNLARHVADGSVVGYPKAAVVALTAASLSEEQKAFAWIKADVLSPREEAAKVADALRGAALVLDLSASVTVARNLASNGETQARRMSLFLNPSGRDLVLLAEDVRRKMPLDALEMQYYRALVRRRALAGHFSNEDERQRYGQACRDVTSRLPQDLFALHGAIGSRAVRETVAAERARIVVWRSGENMTVRRVDVQPSPVRVCRLPEWTLCIDYWVRRELSILRRGKLPKETGGVLIGSFDLDRKVVYVVDALPSPPDSEEWPTGYIGGRQGLKGRVGEIGSMTDGALQYVGEWHSHPDGCSTAPSREDFDVFAWLTEIVSVEGLPSVMMIAGQGGTASCFIGALRPEESLIPRV